MSNISGILTTGGIWPIVVGNDYLDFNPSTTSTTTHKQLKRYFHTFLHSKTLREITLCIVAVETVCLGIFPYKRYKLNVGYSVKLPTCTKKESLGKDISLGRAMKTPLATEEFPKLYVQDRGILKAVARNWERQLQENINHYIKGIR